MPECYGYLWFCYSPSDNTKHAHLVPTSSLYFSYVTQKSNENHINSYVFLINHSNDYLDVDECDKESDLLNFVLLSFSHPVPDLVDIIVACHFLTLAVFFRQRIYYYLDMDGCHKESNLEDIVLLSLFHPPTLKKSLLTILKVFNLACLPQQPQQWLPGRGWVRQREQLVGHCIALLVLPAYFGVVLVDVVIVYNLATPSNASIYLRFLQ
jgi:hypothetical protein